ncbi:MAG: hypothetical protein GF418_01395 [Chitinivibrionales bacterium]|nr:hypothetical protein [Chitinivibrionales bacterium]MBD3394257.1 hypothetical protein [Chitinivibrionales bacterium]
MRGIFYACLCALIAVVSPASSETGMCLVVCSGSGIDRPGDIRRIDYENDQTINTSDILGYGVSPRFAPDGNGFAYITGTTVKICDLDGTVTREFSVAASDGNISYTADGIYQASGGQIHLYDLDGNETWNRSFSDLSRSNALVSANGNIAGGVEKIGTWRVVIYDLESGETRPIMDEQGCSACPSPDGSLMTQNMGSPCHTEMRIRNTSDGSIAHHLVLETITGLDVDNTSNGRWCWNRQTWSSNSNEWVILPIGLDNQMSGCRQLRKTCSPWIYKLGTQKAVCLVDRTADFWMPTDYYSGKVYNGNVPSLKLSETSLEFLADSGDANPASQTVIATTTAGALEDVSVTGATSWLSVDLSAASGNDIALTNSISIAGLSTGNHTATIEVATSNAGTKTYTVTAVIKSQPVISEIAVAPSLGVVEPGGQVQFGAEALDQYGELFSPQPAFAWTVSGGGAIDASSGLFAAGTTEGGPHTVTAAGGGMSGIAQVRVATTPDIHVKVNCGDNRFDVDGWDPDDDYLNNNPSNHTWSGTVDIAGVENAAPQDVYKSVVHNDHDYNFPDIPNGTYTLRLHLADEHSDRTMTYIAEGRTILDNFDIVSEVGQNKALTKDFTVAVTDGNGLQLECNGNGGDVFECGLEIIGYSTQQDPVRLISPNGGEGYAVGQTITIMWEAADPSGSFVIQVSLDAGLSWHQITGENGVTGGAFKWQIPPHFTGTDNSQVPVNSDQCMVKLYEYATTSLEDVSDGVFSMGTGEGIVFPGSPGPRAPFTVRATGEGLLYFIVRSTEPYTIDIVAPNGAIIDSRSGRGPWHHVYARRPPASGTYIVKARVGARRYARRMAVLR